MVKNVIGIQIAGYDRNKTIKNLIKEDLPYKLLLSKDYPYSRKVKISFDNVKLDPLYEAKAYDYMVKYMMEDLNGKKVLFWIVGDSNPVLHLVISNSFTTSLLIGVGSSLSITSKN